MRAVLATALALAVAVLATGCGESQAERGSSQPQGTELALTLGTKNFTESFILGELYRQALAASGYNVTLRKNIGSTEVVDQALQRGDIDAYPEYLGVAATVVAGEAATAGSAAETYRIARASTPRDIRRSAGRRRSRTSTRSRRRGTSLSASTCGRSPTCAASSTSRSARDPSSRLATRAWPACRRATGSPMPSSSRWPSVPSTSHSTRATSTPPTCSPPTASCPRGTTRCSSTLSGCSATSTSRS